MKGPSLICSMTITNLYVVWSPVMGKIAPLPCGSLRKANARGVNLKQNKEWSPSGRASDLLDTVPATPAANLVPNVVFYIPLEHTSKAERGILVTGLPRISILIAQACTLERSLQRCCTQWRNQHRWQQFPRHSHHCQTWQTVANNHL